MSMTKRLRPIVRTFSGSNTCISGKMNWIANESSRRNTKVNISTAIYSFGNSLFLEKNKMARKIHAIINAPFTVISNTRIENSSGLNALEPGEMSAVNVLFEKISEYIGISWKHSCSGAIIIPTATKTNHPPNPLRCLSEFIYIVSMHNAKAQASRN